MPATEKLSPALVGRRVVVRHRVAGGAASDALGDLVAWRDGVLRVRTKAGEVTVAESDVLAGKTVPERRLPHAREATAAQVHRISTRSWRPLEQAWLGGWLLRAGGGFTGRANSVLPLGDPGRPAGEALAAVESWYAERGIAPRFQLPMPDAEAVEALLVDRGWPAGDSADVMVADVPAALATLRERPDLPPVSLDPEPSEAWLATYHYRGGALPPVAVRMLTNHDRAVFPSVVDNDGTVLAIARGAVDDGWLGVAAVEVTASARRRGLGRHVMRGLLAWAAEQGARHAHLQVDVHNDAARAMYDAMGFTHHHTYRYRLHP